MKVGTTFELTTQIIEKARNTGITDLVFHKMHVSIEKSALQGFHLHDTGKLSSDGKNYAFLKVKSQLEAIEVKVPRIFNYDSYNLREAMIKDMYWSLIIDNLIEQKCIEIAGPHVHFIHLDKHSNYFSDVMKFFFRLIKSIPVSTGIAPHSGLKNRLALRINSVKGIAFYGKLLSTLGAGRHFVYQSFLADRANETAAAVQSQGFENIRFNYKKRVFYDETWKFLKAFFKTDTRFLNLVIDTKRKLVTVVTELERMAESEIHGILLCAGENEGEGLVSGMVAKKYSVKSFNFMNGTKTNDYINGLTNFDVWFMHDLRMQKMIMSLAHKSEESLPITGHLLEDVAKEHHYAGTLDDWWEKIEGKKIIALFSSTTYNVEQLDVENLLIEVLNEVPDALVLARLHPGDKHSIPFTHERMILLPDFKERSAPALFDLLQLSHIAISFGSTVSLQATWFGIPSVSFEFSEKSLLLYADQEKVHHFNNTDKLHSFLLQKLREPKVLPHHIQGEKSVAQKMTEILLH